MKILYFHQFFNTPEQGGSIRSYLLSRELQAHGHEVIIITSHNQKSKKIEMDGLTIIYLQVAYQNEYKFWQRIISYSNYTIQAIWESLRTKNVELCYVMTTPLLTGFIGLVNKLIKKRPYIFEVGDLWPTVPIAMGFIQSPILKKFTFWLEKIFYQNAVGNIGLSQPIRDYILQVAPTTPSSTVYNISDCTFFQPSEKPLELINRYKIQDQFVISYTGTFGLANDLSRVIDLAKSVSHLPITFILVGSGADKPKISALAQGVENISILDQMSKEGVQEIVSISDAMFVSFANYESLWTGSPNKLYDALAAGKLVITNFEGWVAELIDKQACGFSFNHDFPSDFEQKIKPFLKDTTLLQQSQFNARKLAEEQFELSIQSKIQRDFIQQVTQSHF
ncbi:MAG: glycosyltransferase family 4 protein [Reichenbachiella sp.]